MLDAQHYFEQLPPDLFSDECHFTPQGYERMARLVREELVADEARRIRRRSERQQADGRATTIGNGDSTARGLQWHGDDDVRLASLHVRLTLSP